MPNPYEEGERIFFKFHPQRDFYVHTSCFHSELTWGGCGANRILFRRYNGWLLRVETEGTKTDPTTYPTTRKKNPGSKRYWGLFGIGKSISNHSPYTQTSNRHWWV